MAWIEYKEPVKCNTGGSGPALLKIRVTASGRVEIGPSAALSKILGFDKAKGYRIFFDSEKTVVGLCVDDRGPYVKGKTVYNLLGLRQALEEKGCKLNSNVDLKPHIPENAKPGEPLVVAFNYKTLLPTP